MEDLIEITNGKYKLINEKINEGAYANIYDVINNHDKNNKYIAKVQKISDRLEAINEIKFLLKLKKNKDTYYYNVLQYFKNLNINIEDPFISEYIKTSKIINIEDFYTNKEYIFIIFKKYEYTLEDFNIIYNKEIQETIPISLTKKIINSLFLGLYELKLSNIIHCDIKPNNILINLNYKNLKELIKDIKRKKVNKNDLIKYIDILYIDFNISQKCNAICKSTTIQTTYYMAPEIILGNTQFNYSIDFWSIGSIIYELITSQYLFDIFGYNIQNGQNFKNYKIQSKKYSSSSESDANSYYDNTDNFILLHFYRDLFGDIPLLHGNKIENYYKNNLLLGTIKNKKYDDNLITFENYIKNNIINNSDLDFYNQIIRLFKKIFIYDYNKRLTCEDFLTNHIFL
jgi:serine/threonine protein kinase